MFKKIMESYLIFYISKEKLNLRHNYFLLLVERIVIDVILGNRG